MLRKPALAERHDFIVSLSSPEAANKVITQGFVKGEEKPVVKVLTGPVFGEFNKSY
jgi:hypothetical protein